MGVNRWHRAPRVKRHGARSREYPHGFSRAPAVVRLSRTRWVSILRGSDQIFCALQLPIQILERAAEIILLLGNQGGISEPIDSSDQAAHHRVSSCDRSPKSRLDCFSFGFEGAVVRDADSGPGCFQKFAQSLQCRPMKAVFNGPVLPGNS